MERQLATIQKIHNITPIDKADKIETIHILGWTCVAKKGEFRVGDLCVYCEVDSILPFAPWSEFLRDKNRPDKPIRIKTIRLRGQLSQGIVFPLSILNGVVVEEGTEVTELLGITKYEIQIPAQLAGTVKGNFPSFCRKSDETRLQSLRSSIYDELDGKECYVTLKVDGTSATYFCNRDYTYIPQENGTPLISNVTFNTGVCSRNLQLKEPEEGCEKVPVYWEIERKYDILNKLTSLPMNLQIIGEVYGEGIQKNKLGIKGHDLAVFSIFDIDMQSYKSYREMVEICERFGLPTVPILKQFLFHKDVHTLEYWLNYAKGKYAGTEYNREGIVVRPMSEMYSETLHGRLSFKVINNDYLEKDEE